MKKVIPRSFERSRSEAGKYLSIEGVHCSRLLYLDVRHLARLIIIC